MTIPSEHLLVIDGNNLVRRIHAAIKQEDPATQIAETLRSCRGSFRRARENHPHTHAVAVFDASGQNWRHRLYPQYKADRGPSPDGLADLMKSLRTELEAQRLRTVSVPDIEADDAIAVLALRWQQRNRGAMTILSTDKDLCALLSPSVSVYDHFTNVNRDAAWVLARFGIEPGLIQDYLALVGDKTDNIPGVKGIGPVTAVKLLREFKSLQGILESRSIQKVARQVMRDREMALVSQALVQFKTDVSIGLSWADLRAGDGVGRDE
ncbi:5'-3' exonuclease H3TH domain-containing protein [Solimonas sp. K1W22B-7]|uniref:5'-3' exonuclease H3TH domain-containing protein n=2 Tax=Pseudomonadota TaxID=1224 RepID=UPI0013C52684|nr:5'-3' exonuclease H3TH domain-containing protein [Solimonas sp. K1W22B-7]